MQILTMTNSSHPYHPTSKPSKPSSFSTNLPWRKSNIYTFPLVLFLCISSYFFGLWQQGGVTDVRTNSNRDVTTLCNTANKIVTTATTTNQPTLDFSTHHNLKYSGAALNKTRRAFPRCDVSYSEYTPCEDQKRSLRFSRYRLIYRERHCPEKHELLKCRVPAPYGYKNPFPWPRSRDLAWFSNVPHKELTVEKAVQNWIRFDGDRFRFPGGGTMFPHGADAYIDDIGKLINSIKHCLSVSN